ncbi:MAG: DUF4145 domain-containing protein [Hungatella sp.]|nr:DUF4145 domain-containing protein [Hungatella sp.]
MAMSDITSTWENIRRGVKDAELLIGEKKYNMSMIKSRQVLELMIHYLCDNASISESDLASSIDVLYEEEWISKTTCEHYHKIRMLGNKAVHEGNDNGYDANQAYHLLSQEVYIFANDYKSKRSRSSGGNAGSRSGSRPSAARSSNSRDSGRRTPSGRSSGSRNSSRRTSASRSAKSRRRQPASGFSVSPTDLIRLGLILAVLVVIIFAVRLLKPKETEQETETSSTPAATTMVPETFPTTQAPPVETMAETTPAPVYKTSDTLNVRSEPSTAGTKLGLLEAGTIVDYVEDYDDEWTIINYNGAEAYVSSQYLVHD